MEKIDDAVKEVVLPGSKSIAARALIAREVAGSDTELLNLPDCDDTRELDAALCRLRTLRREGDREMKTPSEPMRINLGTGATTLRFFTALAAALPGVECVADCSDGLRRRPLKGLTEALRRLGADITFLEESGHAPMLIRGQRLKGGAVEVSTGQSSQFLSALWLVSPLMERPLMPIAEEAKTVSAPYIEMTRRITEIFYGDAPRRFAIEADWSAAAFFYEWIMLQPCGTRLRFPGLLPPGESLQGDSECAAVYSRLGVRSCSYGGGIEIVREGNLADRLELDLNTTPDMVPSLAAGCCAAGVPFRFNGVAHLRHKESDRLAALVAELDKAGFLLREGEDSLYWFGERCAVSSDSFDSHSDHRIAMALAAAFPGRKIRGAACVAKSFPGFFDKLDSLRERD